ncbi:hypothetical protein [Actinocorallia libanotica]|uniref:Uncharacterized protein n=1 Tax=Actinocorallia libanotica TaxID=46162 RepID=A0ABP4CIU5_9ACTN
MDSEIQWISDDEGLLLTGDSVAVKKLLLSEGLWSSSLDLTQRLKPFLGIGTTAAQAASEIAANSSLWVKLTRESAHLAKKHGLRESSKTGNLTGVVRGEAGGQIRTFVEFAKGPGSPLNPAMLSGVAGIMAQTALQQSLAEITAYLARIDAKVDDILRKLDDTVRKDMIGAGFQIQRAKTMQKHEGRVTDDSWSEVQNASGKIADVQGYALLQLQEIARKTGEQTKIGDLAETAGKAEGEVQEWLAILARGLQLQVEFDLLGLDRALYSSPEDLDARRRGLRADRQNRLESISRNTESLLACMDAAAHRANTKLLWNPTTSPAVVRSRNHVATSVHDFHELLGIESEHQPLEARGWMDAAAEAGNKALEKAGSAAAGIASSSKTLEKAGPAAVGIAAVSTTIVLRVLQNRGEKG